jgi:hypothetical protein
VGTGLARRAGTAYPTWIGYDVAGTVTCFVADMLLFPPIATRTTEPAGRRAGGPEDNSRLRGAGHRRRRIRRDAAAGTNAEHVGGAICAKQA